MHLTAASKKPLLSLVTLKNDKKQKTKENVQYVFSWSSCAATHTSTTCISVSAFASLWGGMIKQQTY